MGPIGLAGLLFPTRSALAETDPSRQIVATGQGGGAFTADCMIKNQFNKN
jgi:hypothetical protein